MLNESIDNLAINKRRLDNSISINEMGIPCYALERNDRKRNGCGVALYIRNTIVYERDKTPLLVTSRYNGYVLKVDKPKAKPFLVATWYRPPSSTISLMDAFESLLGKLESQDIEINIFGDLNYDVSSTPCDHHISRLLEICNIFQYQQLIEQPTRVTKNTSTTIYLLIIYIVITVVFFSFLLN